MNVHPVVMVILDGWGIAPPGPGNAVHLANPATFNRLWEAGPCATLKACGEEVGLPARLFGNSEVGHLNLGAGRIVWQDVSRIDKDIREGGFFRNPALLEAVRAARPEHDDGGAIHLMGLVSDGGVHSSLDHLFAILELLKREKFPPDRVFVHAITDGRDTSPNGGLGYVARLQQKLDDTGVGRIATVCGRFYAMDRDKRWDRTEKAWDACTLSIADVATDAESAIEQSYAAGVTDEFILPRVIINHGEPLGRIRDGDVVLWFNFRADRARQFCRALTQPDFDGFVRKAAPKVTLVTMTQYAQDIRARVAYAPQSLKNTLGEYLAGKGVQQFRCAETEKYAHVTYFFNGGVEQPNPGEERKLVPSPKVATYDLKPEMSSAEVADSVVAAIHSGRFGFVLVNFANPDMLGHTGVLAAAVAGVRATDQALARVLKAAEDKGCAVLVTADHGNAEEMFLSAEAAADPANREQGATYAPPANVAAPPGMVASTQHSHNPVPLILAGRRPPGRGLKPGRLADVAPTVLELMGLPRPDEMTGESLLT
ncbi:MAG: 2,3-bisphosphoglycerate-independent phosphoglycerate mutase [Planctomycetes bacterium]|jgi:2,3-bisphosphoglycerate-independent phosphoglycerate mutase|nr:2,3-bisphosphoglycerate-independent phosphoglycerate mutase [Planctomycetota bacterium]MCL4729688.1 2,3-bisphosphoglycerate-independent phosphoglycerate mutase [Planctomycetota bacterium]